MLKTKWINFITKQYKKYYPDPIDDMFYKMQDIRFKSRCEAYKFMETHAIAGLKNLFELANKRIIRKEDVYDKRNNNNKTTV